MATIATAELKTIELKNDWNEPGSSASDFESAIVEVEYLLIDAPNVKDAYLISNGFGDMPQGFAIEFIDGTRNFILAGEGSTLSFGPGGNLVSVSTPPTAG
jgi:hypothetical protein